MNEKSLLLNPKPDEIEKHNDLIANGTVAVVSAADFRKNYPENIVGRLRGILDELRHGVLLDALE